MQRNTRRLSAIAFTMPLGAMVVSLSGCSITGGSKGIAERTAAVPTGEWLDARANVYSGSTQASTSLDIDSTGNLVVVWDSRRQQDGQYGVYARLLNAAGEPLSDEVQVNEFVPGAQMDPAVASGASGSWIVWTSYGQDAQGGAILARRFDANLQPMTGEIILSDAKAGNQSDPAIAINERGEANVVWNTTGADIDGTRVEGRIIDGNGSILLRAFAIEPPSGAIDSLPSVATAGDEFIVAWSRRTEGADSSHVHAAHVTAQGDVAHHINVTADSTFAGGENIEPAVAAGASGEFVVVWHHAGAGENNHRVVMQRFGRDGATVHSAVFASSVDAGWVGGAAVALDGDDRALVAWNQWGLDGDGLGIAAKWFAADGSSSGDSFTVSRHAAGHQAMTMACNARRLVCTERGQIALAWSGDGGFDDDSAANVSVYLPASVAVMQPTDTVLASAASAPPMTPIPPTFDPNWEPLPPLEDPGDGASGSFVGINFTGWTPPDPELAVGPNHLVGITNGAIAFFDKSTGANLFQDEIEDSFGFWGAQGATGFCFDPEVLFDPHSNRFFAMCCERASNGLSYYLFAVSDDSNPMGTWHKYRIHTPVDNDIDSPNLAVDDTVVYLSADFFGPDKYGIIMINKAVVMAGGVIDATNSRTHLFSGASEQSMGLPQNYDTNAPAGYIIQSAENGNPNGITFSEVRFHAIQNQLSAPTRVSIDIAVPAYTYPNQPPQMGTANRPFLFEPRFWSCAVVGGSMWAVHHVNNVRCRARWYEFDMRGWPDSGQNPLLVQSGELDYGGSVHTFFPSIAADTAGNAAIIFARSSPTEFISMCGTYRLSSDALGTMRPMEFIKVSTVPYTGANRWGDYSGVEPDPTTTDGFTSFWGMHEWTDSSNAWRTWIARIDTAPEIATLTDVAVQFGTLISGGLPEILDSDDARLRVRSAPGFIAQEANVLDIRVGAETTNLSAAALNISVEGRLNNPGGTSRWRLRNWSNNQLEQVHQHAIGTTETVVSLNNIPATNRIRQTDGRIELSLRQFMVATFTAQGFDSFTDHVIIAPQ